MKKVLCLLQGAVCVNCHNKAGVLERAPKKELFFNKHNFFFCAKKKVGDGSGAHWVLSTPKALTLVSPLVCPNHINVMPDHVG